jgi:small redox-active disulfide protein 2
MDEVRQLRVGKHMTGIIGLDAVLVEAAERCKGMTDEQIGGVLLEMLARHNYIEPGVRDEYAQAFLRAYKKHIGEPVMETPVQGLSIKVLGPGCAQCDRLEREVMAVMAENRIAAEFEHVRDLAEIARLGIMGTPALLINGEVRAVGSVPSREKIRTWIVQAAGDAAF